MGSWAMWKSKLRKKGVEGSCWSISVSACVWNLEDSKAETVPLTPQGRGVVELQPIAEAVVQPTGRVPFSPTAPTPTPDE